MKLLPKSQIHIKKAAEQRQSIDEGKKLAKQVDRLREVAADEEVALDKFRSETLSRIHQETTEAATKRDELLGEVRELEAAKREALQPLTAMQEALNSTKVELERKEAIIASQGSEMEAWEQTLSHKEKEIKETLLRIETKEEAVTKKIVDIINTENETKQYHSEARQLKKETDSIRNTLQTELVHREKLCTDRENSIIIREQQLEADKSALMKEWRLLEDRKQAFARSINRLKK